MLQIPQVSHLTLSPTLSLTVVSQEDLIPHSPVLLLFTTSAQTHIFPEIRIDAIRFLDLLLEHIPDVVTEGWAQSAESHGRRVLEGYLGVLDAGTTFGEGGGAFSVHSSDNDLTQVAQIPGLSRRPPQRALCSHLQYATLIFVFSPFTHTST